MALQINKQFNNGIIATKCYIKITSVRYSKMSSVSSELTGPEITVSFYFNKAARDDSSTNYIEQNNYILSDFSKETRASYYKYIKTLDDFSDSINV